MGRGVKRAQPETPAADMDRAQPKSAGAEPVTGRGFHGADARVTGDPGVENWYPVVFLLDLNTERSALPRTVVSRRDESALTSLYCVLYAFPY